MCHEIGNCDVCRGITPLSSTNTPPYMEILRMDARKPNESSIPVIQIHGSTRDPSTIVLTREGYRTLLNTKPSYGDFLTSLMATRTVLYVGFSFTDEYLNEHRSEVIAMRHRKVCDRGWGVAIQKVAVGEGRYTSGATVGKESALGGELRQLQC